MATEKLTSVDGEITKCDFEMDADSKSKKKRRISLTRTQVVAVVIVFAAIVIMVGVLCFLETKKECDRKHAALMNDKGVDNDVNDTDNDGEDSSQSDPENELIPDPSATDDPGPWNGRLPTDVIPDAYDLHIKPYLNEDDIEGTNHTRFTFEGRVVIRLRCDKVTDEIVLHLKNLRVLSIMVVDAENGGEDLYDSKSYESRYDFLRISLTKQLQLGQSYNVTLDYIGEIREDWDGIYRSSYIDDTGNRSWMAVTQMEPVSARYALPCFDEPTMKAVFHVRITHRNHMVALSNGREIDTIDLGDGWSMTSFGPSPIMSTYLLALAVGVLDYRETNTTNGVRLRTWSRPNAIETTLFALESASALLTHFEEYFDIPYPMSKMDMIAVPDYGHGGMENWGLVTYPEVGLFYDPDVNTGSDQEAMLTVISHEMAHQWFGNLVTMEWWDDLWLNEGFGTYFGHLGADALYPELKSVEKMISLNSMTLKNDAYSTSHPVKESANSPSEIGQLFDDMTYSKAAAVLRMLHNILGDDVFQSGIQRYLRTYEYSNAYSDQLWDAFTQADEGFGNVDVWLVMDTWILQMGYPLVNLSRLDETKVSATQQRYITRGEEYDPRESPYGYVWAIYLTYTHNGSRDYDSPSSVWIRDQEEHYFNLTGGVTSNDWYLANIHQFGFFRVTYDMDNWAKLIKQLNADHEAIPVLNRAQLLEDSFALAINGQLPFSVAFELALYLRNELSSAPWSVALNYFVFFRDHLGATALQGPYEKYLRELTSRAYDEFGLDLGTKEISPDEEKTREIILPMACKVRNPDCSRQALELFDDFRNSYNLSDPSSNVLEVSSMDTLLCTAIREGTYAEWDYLWSLYTDPRSTFAQTKRWLTALSCTVLPWQIQRLFEYPMLDPRTQRQVGFILEKVSVTPVGRTLAWDYLRENWETLQNMYDGRGSMYRWIVLVGSVTSDFYTVAQLEEIKAFANSRDLGLGSGAINRAITRTSLNIARFERIYPEVKDWLEAYDQTH